MLIGVDAGAFGDIRAGVARYLREMLREMMLASIDDDFVLYATTPIEVPLPPGRWRVRLLGPNRSFVPGHWLRDTIPRAIAEDRIDVFWGQNAVMPLRVLVPCRRVLTIHDLTGLVFPRAMKLRNRLFWRTNLQGAARAADAIVAVSRATGRLVQTLLGVPRDRIFVVPEGRAQGLLRMVRANARRDVAGRFGLPDVFLLTVGTIEPRKDQLTLLDAVRRNESAPLLVIVGAPGWKSRSVIRAIRSAESRGAVRYLGQVNDQELANLYSAAELMVYPSLYEGFGLPVLEAMASGCPVLCSWSSSLPEVGGTAARYFRPHNVDDLAAKLSELLSDSSKLAEMSEAGIAQAAKFSFEVAARSLLGVFHGSAAAHRQSVDR